MKQRHYTPIFTSYPKSIFFLGTSMLRNMAMAGMAVPLSTGIRTGGGRTAGDTLIRMPTLTPTVTPIGIPTVTPIRTDTLTRTPITVRIRRMCNPRRRRTSNRGRRHDRAAAGITAPRPPAIIRT